MAAPDARFVAYYRVSTERQGASGLGLEAQREAVGRFLGSSSLLAEFTEVESGKRHTNRPELLRAVELCRRQRGTLVIAKLDRLARSVHFISGLMETGVEFIAADMPEANRLTIHILADFAEHEREAISQRTKGALAAARRRGARLGNPRWAESIVRARQTKDPIPPAPQIVELMRRHRAEGMTCRYRPYVRHQTPMQPRDGRPMLLRSNSDAHFQTSAAKAVRIAGASACRMLAGVKLLCADLVPAI